MHTRDKHSNPLNSPFASRSAVGVFFFISGFNFAAWAARIPALQKQLHLNDAELGTVLAALPTGLMITMPLAGTVLSKISSRYVMLISAVLYTLLLCLLATATTFWEAVLILFLFGASRNFFNISVNTQSIGVQALYIKSIVTTFHGIWSLAALFGAAISFLMISANVTMLNHFLIVASISLILMLLVFKNTLLHDKKSSSNKVAFALPDRPLIQLGLIGFVSMVCEGTMSDWSGIYFSKVLMVPDALVTTGYVAYLTAMVIGRFAGDWLVNKIGAKRLLQLSSIIITTGFFISVFLPYIITAAFGFVCIGFGVSCIMPLVFSITPKISTLSTGSAVAAISTVSYLGFLTWSFIITGIIAFLIYFIVYRLKTSTPKNIDTSNAV
jgi:MFS family permease